MSKHYQKSGFDALKF